jgi:glycosyltransferase involved in cell wall biosynthesis
LGQKPYEEVAAYMAACDVLIMPWNQNEWIRACNPVKLKEYLAVGRPVVSTPFPELKHYDDVVRSAGDAAGFAHEIELALREPPEPGRLRWRVCDQTWDAKARDVLANLRDLELVYEGGEADLPAEPVHAVGAS